MIRLGLSISACLVAALTVAAGAQEVFSLDAPVERFQLPRSIPLCGMTATVARLAKDTSMLVGLEREAVCAANEFPALDLSDAETLEGVRKRDLLDRIVGLVPDYSWRDVDGIAVLRPTSAWRNPRNLLAAPVPAFRATYDATVPHLMNAVFRRPDHPPETRTIADKQSFPATFAGGTLLDGLNALIRGAAAATGAPVEWTFQQTDEKVDVEIWHYFRLKTPSTDGVTGARDVHFTERLSRPSGGQR